MDPKGEYGTKDTEGYLDWCECCSDDDTICEGNPDAVVEIRPAKTIPELKELLKAQGLPVSGKKADLIERLASASGDEGGEVDLWILVCTECGCSEHPKLTGRKLFPCAVGYEGEKLLKKYNINW